MFRSSTIFTIILLFLYTPEILAQDQLQPWEKYFCNSKKFPNAKPRFLACCSELGRPDFNNRIGCSKFKDEETWKSQCVDPRDDNGNKLPPRPFVTCCEGFEQRRIAPFGVGCSDPYVRTKKKPEIPLPVTPPDSSSPGPSIEIPEFIQHGIESVGLPGVFRGKDYKQTACISTGDESNNCADDTNLDSEFPADSVDG